MDFLSPKWPRPARGRARRTRHSCRRFVILPPVGGRVPHPAWLRDSILIDQFGQDTATSALAAVSAVAVSAEYTLDVLTETLSPWQ